MASLALLLGCALAPLGADDWPTYRGSLERTGSLDGVALEGAPAVLWALPGKNHYLAAPSPAGGRIFLPALGAFNTPLLQALNTPLFAAERLAWSRAPPALRLPPACSPVVAGGQVIVGEGMHQNSAGAVSAFSAADGLPLWRLELPGELRHVEGSPAVAGTRIYFGCGSEGVLCVDCGRVRLGAGEIPLAQAEEAIRRRWQELLLAYEREKKDDPDFAVPPSVADLPLGKVTPLWTAGKDRWHVDSPVALAGERLVAGSAFLDREQLGERALLCLDAADGSLLWRVPLEHNPWAAPSVARPRGAAAPAGGRPEAIVIAGSSSVRYEPARLEEAEGEVAGVELETGKLLWRRPIPGGVLSPVAIDSSGELGLFTATDGKVRALNTGTGHIVWSSPGKAPCFAGVTLAGPEAYAVDIDGGVRALEAASGRELWSLDLGRLTGLPGRVYASPLGAGGRLYVATCNLEGPHAGAPTAVICVGARSGGSSLPAGIAVDREGRRVVVDAAIAPRKLAHLDRVYPIEIIAGSPRGKKAHETVLVTEVRPSDVHRALEALGLRPGNPGLGHTRGSGPEVRLAIEFPGLAGLTKRMDLARAVVDRKTGLPLPGSVRWYFTGSASVKPDPAREEEIYGADAGGTLVTVYPVTNETVLQSSLGLEEEALLNLEVASRLPPVGTPVKLVIELPAGGKGEE
jgi:outer membrane protein assembly factor BamB